MATITVAAPTNGSDQIAEWTRKQALSKLNPTDLTQATCLAFYSYNSPVISDLTNPSAAPAEAASTKEGNDKTPWRQWPETRYTGSCYVTVLDEQIRESVFNCKPAAASTTPTSAASGGGILEVSVAASVADPADLHAVLSLERLTDGFLRDQVHVVFPQAGYTQFLVRDKANARLRVQLFQKDPASKTGDSRAVNQVFAVTEAPETLDPYPQQLVAVDTLRCKDGAGQERPVKVTVSWRLVPLNECLEKAFPDRKPCEDLRKEFDRIMKDGDATQQDRWLAWLARGMLPWAAGKLQRRTGSGSGDGTAEDDFKTLRRQVPPLRKLAFLDGPDTDTQVWLHHDPATNKLVVSFRGTEQEKLLEWLVDISAHTLVPREFLAINARPSPGSKVLVHTGFFAAYNTVRNAVKELVYAYLERHPGCEVVFTGHSLGGALATLAAYDMARPLKNAGHTGAPYGSLRVYTYGAPRVGNLAFMREYNELVPDTWRFTNTHDIVPRIPDTWRTQHDGVVSYYHVGAHIELGPQSLLGGDTVVVTGEKEEQRSRNPVQVGGFIVTALKTYLTTALKTALKKRLRHDPSGVASSMPDPSVVDSIPELRDHMGASYATSMAALLEPLLGPAAPEGPGTPSKVEPVPPSATAVQVVAASTA